MGSRWIHSVTVLWYPLEYAGCLNVARCVDGQLPCSKSVRVPPLGDAYSPEVVLQQMR